MRMIAITAALATGLFASQAYADCAGNIAKIDEAMKAMTLDEANATKAKELLDKAKAAQAANDETGCTAATTELMTLVGMPAAQ